MKSNHSSSIIRILLYGVLVLVLLELCLAQNKNRIKRTKRFEESEIYDDIIRAEDDEFVDDVPIDETEVTDDDNDDVEYENCIEYQGGHKETYVPHRDKEKESKQKLSFNPYTYYKSLLDQDLNYVKYYGDKVTKDSPPDSPASQIAKKYANNLANHAKYLYKYRTFAPASYRKYVLQVYEYSKRVVEVAKVQNWNGYMYYLSITIEYYRKIDVLEQVGYAGTNYVQTTPVASYYGAGSTPNSYYSNAGGGTVPANAPAVVATNYAPVNYGAGGYPNGAVGNYYPYQYAAQPYNGYPTTGSYYPSAAYNYYPQQYAYQQRPVVAAGVAKSSPPATTQASTPTQSNASAAGTTASSTQSNASSTSTAGASTSSTSNETKPTDSPIQKRKLDPQSIKESEQLSSHVGEFNDDFTSPTSEAFSFDYLM